MTISQHTRNLLTVHIMDGADIGQGDVTDAMIMGLLEDVIVGVSDECNLFEDYASTKTVFLAEEAA